MEINPNDPLGGGLGDVFGGKDKWKETIEELALYNCNSDKNISLMVDCLEGIMARLDVIESRNITLNINAGKIIILLQSILETLKEIQNGTPN